ncbi:MAG: hypothetical protein CM1200mP29_00210 [Verrucomicrobiota bacterium]|nr:MAG: hypothetical protein CM1200mP29_00210 [Verrucomicrobiota bacterium]
MGATLLNVVMIATYCSSRRRGGGLGSRFSRWRLECWGPGVAQAGFQLPYLFREG